MHTNRQPRQIFWWSLFDFANSIVVINLGLYFSQWIVIEQGVSEFWYNFVDVVVTILLLLTLPALGAISDMTNKKVLFLRLTSIPIFIFTLLIGFSSQTFSGFSPILITFLSFLFIIYFYQLSLIFYHAMLGDIAKRERYGTISGIGLAAGWIGGIVGLLIILPFVKGDIPFFQPAGRIQAFIPCAIIFAVLIGISLTFLKEPQGVSSSTKKISVRQAYTKVWDDIKNLRKNPVIFYFLIAYWLFIDAILTIQDNSALYLEIVLNIPDQQKVLFGSLVLIMAAFGALILGRVGDKIGYIKTLTVIVFGWIIALVLFLQVESGWSLLLIGSLLGILFGGTWTITRALYLVIIPAAQRAEYFGFYGCTERFASIIGPLVWSIFVVGLKDFGPVRYKVAVISMIVLIGISLFFLRKMHIYLKKGGQLIKA